MINYCCFSYDGDIYQAVYDSDSYELFIDRNQHSFTSAVFPKVPNLAQIKSCIDEALNESNV